MSRSRILIAEDDPDILELVAFKLNEAGFDIVTATDGVTALAAIEADPPRLAILDVQMPGMSGIEVLSQVRASQTISDLDVILLSAYASDSDIDRGLATGADDYMVKPFSPDDLLQHVVALTKQNRALQQIQARALSTHEVILDVGRAVRAASSSQEALDAMCVALGEGLGVDRVIANTVGLRHELQLAAQWHRPAVQPMGDLTQTPELGALAHELWRSAGHLAEDDLRSAATAPELVRPFLEETGARAAVLVPIGLDDQVIGTIYVAMIDMPRIWATSETDIVQAVAGFVARAIVESEHQREYLDRIEKLDRQKSDFLAAVSHELRTPLTSISGYVELLQGPAAKTMTVQQQHRMLEVISRNTVRLRSLIEAVMVLSRIEGGVSEADFVEVSIRALITRVGEELRGLAEGSDITVQTDGGAQRAMVLGDRVSLDRALVNIVSNAIKFSRTGGVVTLRCELDLGSRRVRVICQDHGVGIPADDLDDLFTRFFRATNARNRAIPGAGLGLSIARQIVEDHHGELRLSSVEDEGTTVVMELPIHEQR